MQYFLRGGGGGILEWVNIIIAFTTSDEFWVIMKLDYFLVRGTNFIFFDL